MRREREWKKSVKKQKIIKRSEEKDERERERERVRESERVRMRVREREKSILERKNRGEYKTK